MFTIAPVTPINGEAALSLIAAKSHLRVTTSDEDTLIATYRDAALEMIERHCGVSLVPRQWRIDADRFSTFGDTLVRPITAVVSVSATDASGVTTALASTAWRLAQGRLLPAFGTVWPYAASVSVVVTAGYAAIPAPLLAAAMLTMGNLYANREGVVIGKSAVELPMAVETLCAPFRDVVI